MRDTTEHSAAAEAGFDITTGTGFGAHADADAVDSATSTPAVAGRVTAAAPDLAAPSGWLMWIVVVIAITAIVA